MTRSLRFVFILVLTSALGLLSYAQNGTITGKVLDESTGEALIGAAAVIEGTTIGTVTNVDGIFVLSNIKAGKIELTVSFIGYKKIVRELTIGANETVTSNFNLLADMMQLDELVVIGYGTKRKKEITGSIVSVKSDELRDVGATDAISRIEGRAVGTQLLNNNGLAGGEKSIRIRGTSSLLTSSEPLYVVDGVPIISGNTTDNGKFADGTSALAQINPEDIESMEILKDASAAAIYGSRSANGVVLITTKQGKKGDAKVDVNYYRGTSSETNRLALLNGPEYLKYAKQAYLNSALYDPETRLMDLSEASVLVAENNFYNDLPFGIDSAMAENTNTDWVDEMMRVGLVQNFNISTSGATDKTTYFLSGTYRDEKGILVGNDFVRTSGRVNITHQVKDWLQVGTNFNITNTKINRVPTSWAGGLGTAQSRSLPIMPIDTNGVYFAPRSGVNVVAFNENFNYVADATSILSNVFAKFDITDHLSFRSDYGLNDYYLREETYQGTITQEVAEANDRRLHIINWNWINTLQFKKDFNAHSLTALGGSQLSASEDIGSYVTGTDFPAPSLQLPGNASTRDGGTWHEAYRFSSLFGRLAYDYSDKYYMDFSVRYDGSTRFGKDHRWGVFPAGSVGWIISEESFWPSEFISFLKLRGSYGLTGNAEFGNFQWFGSYYSTKYNETPGIGYSRIENPELAWEKTLQQDIGIDFAFMQGRVNGGFDYYIKNTTDMLMDVNIPATSGALTVTRNVGAMDNYGFEFFITSRNIVKEHFKWTTDFNIARNKNKIVKITPTEIAGETFGNNYAVQGETIGAWKLVEWYGIANAYSQVTVTDWATDEQTETIQKDIEILPGEELFVNHWGEITNEFDFDRDAKIQGNPYPDYFGGINNTFMIYDFDFSFLFTFSLGQEVYRDDGKFLEGGFDGNWNQMTNAMNAWTPANPEDPREEWVPAFDTDVPMAFWQQDNRNYNSTRYLSEASFVRLKTVVFGYTLPIRLARKIGFSKMRVYFNGQNLLTFTNYPGWDPEVNRDASGNTTRGVTYLSPPQVKSYNFGVNLTF